MSKGKGIDLGLTGYDELFMDDASLAEAKLPRIYDIPLDQIDDFPDHPFKVKLDEDMDQLVESVCANGIIAPVTLRQKEDGRYEMIAGHRRRKACEIAGLPTIKAEIRDLTRDEAIILMVESNLQRSTILPSEKPFSYKMRLDAIKRQAGRHAKGNFGPVGQNSRNELAEGGNDSSRQIQRYIRLTYLVTDLLDMVDEGQIALRPAVELSYLKEQEQADLLETISYEDATPSLAQAIKMKNLSRAGQLTADAILGIMCEKKPNQAEKISFRTDKLKPYIPKNYTPQQTEDYILKALEHYNRHLERVRRQSERYAGQDIPLVEITVNEGETITNTLRRGKVMGIKKDEGGNALAGATIGIFHPNETEYTANTAILTAVSAEDGSFSFPSVPFGSWIIREIAAPEGYLLTDESYPVTVSEDGQVVVIEIVNEQITGDLKLTKVDRD